MAEISRRRVGELLQGVFRLTQIFDLWTEHYSKIDDATQQLLPLRPIWFLAPKE